MKKIRGLFALLIAFFGLFALASCGSGNKSIISSKDVEISATPTKDKIELDITLSENESVKNGSASLWVVCKTVVDENTSNYHSKKDISFTNGIYTHASLSFTSLAANQEYEFILYVTYNAKDSIVTSIKSTTTDTVKTAIATAADFKQNLVQDRTGDFKITEDINFNKDSLGLFNTAANAFKGTIDGGIYENDVLVGCHKLSNITLTSATYIGLFGYLSNATIKNLIIEDVTGTYTSRADAWIGSLAGYAVNSIIDNVTVNNVTISVGATSTAKHYAGGVIGYAEKSSIANTYGNNVSLTYTAARINITAGLFIGYITGDALNNNTFINHCGVKGDFKMTFTYPSSSQGTKGYVYAGGFAGQISSSGLVNDCYSMVNSEFTVSEFDGRAYNVYYGAFVGANASNMYITNSVARTTKMSIYAGATAPEDDDAIDTYKERYIATENAYFGGFIGSADGVFRGIKNSYSIFEAPVICAATTRDVTTDDVTTTETVLFVDSFAAKSNPTLPEQISSECAEINSSDLADIDNLSETLVEALADAE